MADKKTFVHYVADSKTEYNYILKFAVHEMTTEMIDCLEECLKKYELKTASSFRKTPIQENPLDFPSVKNTEVYICNISMGYPASLDFLKTYICSCMGVAPIYLAVYSENDPRQIETDLYVDRNSEEYKKKYKARLGSDYEADEKPAYGADYNINFLKELEKLSKERTVTVVNNPLSPGVSADSLDKSYDSFNDPKNLKKDDVGLFGRVKKTDVKSLGA